MAGTFSVSRAVWDHPVFKGKFTRREAFLWMVSEAAWKPCRTSVRSHMVTLDRGQFTHSIRFMAQRFGWNRSRTERFLNVLKTETMIETENEAGQLVITICNYSTYQLTPNYNDTKSETQSGESLGHVWDTFGTEKNKDNKDNNNTHTQSAHERGEFLPIDWEPNEADRMHAGMYGLSPDEITEQGEQFRDYWTGAVDERSRSRNWHGKWKRWVDKYREDKAKGKANGKHRNSGEQRVDAFERGVEIARRLREQAGSNPDTGTPAYLALPDKPD